MSSLENQVFRLDERIILLFPDSSWDMLYRIAEESDKEKSAADVLLDMLARQVWAFFENSYVYLVTRSITLRGRIVSLPRGDYGCQIDDVETTSNNMVTQAFRMGVKIESDWEIVTPQRGLPFPTTRGAYKLLETIVAEDEEVFPEIMPTDFVWPESKPNIDDTNITPSWQENVVSPVATNNEEAEKAIDHFAETTKNETQQEYSPDNFLQESIDRIVAQAKRSMADPSKNNQEPAQSGMEYHHEAPSSVSSNNYDMLFEQIEAKVDQSQSYEIKPPFSDAKHEDASHDDVHAEDDTETKSNSNFLDPILQEAAPTVEVTPEEEKDTLRPVSSAKQKNDFLDELMSDTNINDFFKKSISGTSDTGNESDDNRINKEDDPIAQTEEKEKIKNEENLSENMMGNSFGTSDFFMSASPFANNNKNQNDTAEVDQQSLIDIWISQAKSQVQPEKDETIPEKSQAHNDYFGLDQVNQVSVFDDKTVKNETYDDSEKADGAQANTDEDDHVSFKPRPQPAIFEDLFDFSTSKPNAEPEVKDGSDHDASISGTQSGNQYEDWFGLNDAHENTEENKAVAEEQAPLQQENEAPSMAGESLSEAPVEDDIPNLLQSLEACGPDFMEALKCWQEDQSNQRKWEILPSIVPLRILWLFPEIEDAKQYFHRAAEQNAIRSVLFMDSEILETQDGSFSQFYKEQWLKRYRQARIESEAETTRLRVLRTNIEQVKKSFQEYADYQEELLRLGVKDTVGSQKPLGEAPQLTRQRKELLYLLSKMQKVEMQLRKNIQASRDISSVIGSNYIQLQESYLELLKQVAERERLIFQSNAQNSSVPATEDLDVERSRNHLNEQIKAIDRFINDSYGSYFKNDPIWEYFVSKDSFGLNQTLTFREHELEDRLNILSNWQDLMENHSVLLEPQIWFGTCQNSESFHTHIYYPHIVICETDGMEKTIEPITTKAWLVLKKSLNGMREIIPGGISPPIDPMMLFEVLSGQEDNPMSKIIWEKQELRAEREDSLYA